MAPSAPYNGQCMCGAVQFQILHDKAVAECHCHCADCAAYSSTPMTSKVLFPFDRANPEETYRITKGAGMLKEQMYHSTPDWALFFCKECGSPVINEYRPHGMMATFPNVLKDYPFRPQYHTFYSNKHLTFPIADGLPKYSDLPAHVGGSDELLGDDYVCADAAAVDEH